VAALFVALSLVGVGALLPFVAPKVVVLATLTLALGVGVAAHPPLATYLLVGITPLVAGIDRGRLLPVLRPAEALEVLIAVALVGRGLLLATDGRGFVFRRSSLDGPILALAVTSSLVPLIWMVARGMTPTQDDIFYGLMIWKYYGLFLIVRSSITSDRQVQTALKVSVAAASIVAIVGIFQALQLFGTPRLLSGLYSPYGNVDALANSRGGSTLALPIAAADLLLLNLGLVLAAWPKLRGGRGVIAAGFAALFALGVVASGEFSALIGLILVVCAVAWVTKRAGMLVRLIPALLGALILLEPVIARRLEGFRSVSGLPPSWQGRLFNLSNYFWPELFSRGNFILGVRPAARVATSTMATGYVWIESGYTWLLWAGGLPLIIAFFIFAVRALRLTSTIAGVNGGAVSIAAASAFAGLVMIIPLMLIDPHLTYRGSSDLLFALLAMCCAPVARQLLRTGEMPA
jgi:hypothetical protein